MTEPAAEKQALRGEMRRLRREMSAEQRAEADRTILARLTADSLFCRAKRVFAYVPMPHEAGSRALPDAILRAGKILGLPVCDTASHTMRFYRLDAPAELREGAYRIPVPPQTGDRLLLPDADTLMIVPMLAFDAAGYRLGAGGGFYDRYLAAYRVQTVGLCYAACRTEALPHDSYDIQINRCITEKTTEEFSHGQS